MFQKEYLLRTKTHTELATAQLGPQTYPKAHLKACTNWHIHVHMHTFICGKGQVQDPKNLIHLSLFFYPRLIKLYAADLLCSLWREISLWTSKRLQLGHHKTLQSARAQSLVWDTSLLSLSLLSLSFPLPLALPTTASLSPALSLSLNTMISVKLKWIMAPFSLVIPWGCTAPCHVTVTIMLLLYHCPSKLVLSSLTNV